MQMPTTYRIVAKTKGELRVCKCPQLTELWLKLKENSGFVKTCGPPKKYKNLALKPWRQLLEERGFEDLAFVRKAVKLTNILLQMQWELLGFHILAQVPVVFLQGSRRKGYNYRAKVGTRTPFVLHIFGPRCFERA